MTIGSLLDFQDAQRVTSKNKNRIFMKQGGNGTSGFERSTADIFPRIVVAPKFQIDKAGKVFTIGSCFARNIEHVLTKFGIDRITSRCIFPQLSSHGVLPGPGRRSPMGLLWTLVRMPDA